MENFSADWEQKILVNELTQGMELAKQLQVHLNVTSSSHETRELLVHKILNSYNKALSMLQPKVTSVGEPQPSTPAPPIGMCEVSPRSLSGSPHSEDSDFDFKDHEPKSGSRKRKTTPRWTKQVQVSPGTRLEGPLDDGKSWRKYGQKDILGARFPRGYYRCTHRYVQGCLATKQVQRSDEDPTIFEITYRGRHTCTPCPHSASPEKHEPNTTLNNHQLINHPPQNQQNPQETLLNFQTGLRVLTEDLSTDNQFYFPPTSPIKAENYVPSHTIMDTNLSPFMSPATSGTNYFPVSPTNITSFGQNQTLPALESELAEIFSVATSAANSPTIGLEFPFGGFNDQFEPNFSFGNPRW